MNKLKKLLDDYGTFNLNLLLSGCEFELNGQRATNVVLDRTTDEIVLTNGDPYDDEWYEVKATPEELDKFADEVLEVY